MSGKLFEKKFLMVSCTVQKQCKISATSLLVSDQPLKSHKRYLLFDGTVMSHAWLGILDFYFLKQTFQYRGVSDSIKATSPSEMLG